MADIMIDIARDFSPYPSGRVEADSEFSGERFREEFLVPALNELRGSGRQDARVVVNIDGVRTFGSSFLEEAFGGLIRKEKFERSELLRLIRIECTKPHLKLFRDSIERYMAGAAAANLG